MMRAKGYVAESKACDFLLAQGLVAVVANYQCRMGEIDLIMRDDDLFVFVEVRQRASHHFGDALESITVSKKNKILKTALFYMTLHQYYERFPMRFDVMGLTGDDEWRWIKNAFGADF